jgi:hypothetical protein
MVWEKNFLNLNLEDCIGEKKGFKHVLTKICEGKFFLNLNSEGGGIYKKGPYYTECSPENFFDPFFSVLKKC